MVEEVFVLRPIGIVKHSYSDEYVRNAFQGVDGFIEVFHEYRIGLRGLEGFSHVIILAYLHKVKEEQKKVLVVKPRGLGRKLGLSIEDLPEVGVFATNSPHRPNPIAITIVKLKNVDLDKGVLYVENLDLYNETPVIDIKPYTLDKKVDCVEVPQWFRDLFLKAGKSAI